MSCWPMMAAASHEPLGWGMVEEGWRKGPWTAEEDRLLIEYVKLHGEGRWNSVSRLAGKTIKYRIFPLFTLCTFWATLFSFFVK